MIWQDIAVATVVGAFVVSILPMIRARTIVPYSTSVLMAGGSFGLAAVYTTLSLWMGFTVEVIGGLLWSVLIFYRWKDKHAR